MTRHLTTDQLLDRLYGVGGAEAEAHLAACAECARRYLDFETRRAEFAAEPVISHLSLAKQRRAIYARIDSTGSTQTRWAPALAAGVLLVVGLFLYRPLTHIAEGQAPAVHSEISDDQLFSDVYSLEDSAEPRAAAPIQGLFEPASTEAVEDSQYR